MPALLIVMLALPIAHAAPASCDWQGDGKNGKEHQHLIVAYAGELSIGVWQAVDGNVAWEVGVRATGAIADPETAPIDVELANGAKVQVVPIQPAPGRVAVTTAGPTTFFDVKATVDLDAMRAIAAGGGVSRVHLVLPSGDLEMQVPPRQANDLGDAAACVVAAAHP